MPQASRRSVSTCAVHEVGVLDLVDARGEVAMPEQGELLAEWDPGLDHPVDPPPPELVDVAEVDERPGDRLEGLGELSRLVLGLVEEPLDGRFQALLDRPLDLHRRGTEASSAEEVGGLAGVERVARRRRPGRELIGPS